MSDTVLTSTPVLSPRLKALLTGMEQDGEAALTAFWNELASSGTPLVERDEVDPNRCLVTFLWRETEPTGAVIVREVFSWRKPEERQLSKLPGTDVWYLSWWIHATVRGTYTFAVQAAGEMDATPLDWTAVKDRLDPLNKHPQPDDWQDVEEAGQLTLKSIMVLPDAEPLPWLERRPDTPFGTVSEHQFASSILGNERRVWVYQPANRAARSGPGGFVVIFDGQRFHSATIVLDNLIAAGAIPPLTALFVHQLDIRSQELTCNPEFSRAIVEELVPWARATFNLTTDPAQTVITGRSYGGLCAGYTALKHPAVFGNVLMQSGSCWYHPSIDSLVVRTSGGVVDKLIGEVTHTPSLIAEYAAAPMAPIRIYQEVGSQELGPPVCQLWQIFANRHFRDLVQAKGYAHTYREFNGGHDDAWWRGTLADGLLELTSHWR